MIHIVAAGMGHPILIVSQQFNIELIEPGSGANVECAFPNLLHRANTRQRQKKSKMIGEVLIVAGDGLAAFKVFGLQPFSIRG